MLTGLGAAGLAAIGGLLTNQQNAEYNAEEAQKNREFQMSMYERQYQDALNMWKLEQKWNTPQSQLSRLRQAGLNPLLMYGQGGVQNVATSAPSTPSQPSGSQARASFVNPFDLAQYQLLDAQREKLNAETEKVKSETSWQEIENRFSKESFDIRMAIQNHNEGFLEASMRKMWSDMVNSSRITDQQVLSMIQGRTYEIKRFNLDYETAGSYIQQGWKNLEYEGSRVSQGWKQLTLDAQRVVNETKMTNMQIGMLQWQLLQDKAMFLPRFDGLTLDNKLKRWDTHLRKATLNEKQIQIWNGVLKNEYLRRFGSEQVDAPAILSPGRYMDFLDHRSEYPTMQQIYTLPWKY